MMYLTYFLHFPTMPPLHHGQLKISTVAGSCMKSFIFGGGGAYTLQAAPSKIVKVSENVNGSRPKPIPTATVPCITDNLLWTLINTWGDVVRVFLICR